MTRLKTKAVKTFLNLFMTAHSRANILPVMKPRKAAIFFILITVTLDMIGLGLVMPSLPDIMRRFTSDEVQISTLFGYFISIYALMQFAASPIIGSLSDRFGRRPVLLVSLLVAAADYVLMAYAPSLTILFIGRVIAGLTGANITVAMAYIADVSDDSNRSKNFGLVGAAFGLGFIIGPALGGILGHYDAHYPFLFAAALNLLNFLFGLFILPESHPKERRRPVELKQLNPLHSLQKVFRIEGLVGLLLVYFCFQMAGQTHGSIWVLYTEKRFSWSTAEVGYSLALVGILSAISQGVLTKYVVDWLGEIKTVFYASLGYGVCFILFGAASQGWMFYALIVLTAVFWVEGPALQSVITNKTPPEQQGELQGSLVSLASLSAIANPLITTKLFAYFSSSSAPYLIPGAPYYFAAAVCFLGFIIMTRIKT